MNEKLHSHLLNFKFESAKAYIEDENVRVVWVVASLAEMFGNIGHFEGHLAVIIQGACESIGVDFSEDFEEPTATLED